MEELARTAPTDESFRIYLVGGATGVLLGWRPSTIDADLYSEREDVFRDIQGIKDRLRLSIEFTRPEQFVPPLRGTSDRHVFIERVRAVEFFHYDPYAQLLSKVVRGFRKDLLDAGRFVESGLVDPDMFRALVERIPDSEYARYPALSPDSVRAAVDAFLSSE